MLRAYRLYAQNVKSGGQLPKPEESTTRAKQADLAMKFKYCITRKQNSPKGRKKHSVQLAYTGGSGQGY